MGLYNKNVLTSIIANNKAEFSVAVSCRKNCRSEWSNAAIS